MWVSSSIRSASVDFPWSIWATMQKFRMWEISVDTLRPWYGLPSGAPLRSPRRKPLVDSPARMANIKSQKKRNIQNEKRHQRNIATKSALKTSTKKVQAAAAAGDAEATTLQREASRELDKAASRGILHKKTAARKKSRLAKAANAATA